MNRTWPPGRGLGVEQRAELLQRDLARPGRVRHVAAQARAARRHERRQERRRVAVREVEAEVDEAVRRTRDPTLAAHRSQTAQARFHGAVVPHCRHDEPSD